jgi:hypothetical protein
MANLLERITINRDHVAVDRAFAGMRIRLLMFSISLRRGSLPSKSWKKCLISKQKI